MPEVREFTLPDLGEGLTEATITRWLVASGDTVAVDQPIVEVETAKALVDVPCPYSGVVTARYGDEGAEIPVGTLLVTVATGPDGERAESSGPAGAADAGAAPEDDGSGNVLVGYGTSAPRERRARIRPAGPPARPPEEDGQSGESRSVPVISPLVRRVAREHGVDLRTVRGSGPDGLIMRSDVMREAGAARPEAPAPGQDAEIRVPLTGMRGSVADKLSRSRREIPDATCWVDADATQLLAARAAMNSHTPPGGAEAPARVSLIGLLARICTAALARYPELNATVSTEAREIVQLPAVHLGFAAQTDRGLLVPVVRDADTLDAVGLSTEIARLTETARHGALTPGELTGSSFTLNNYGVFGVDGSTPILNHPEAAMLGVGRITEKPWVHNGELAVRHVVNLSFTFDHRVCDGGTAGGFLRYIADCVEAPAVLLRTL